MESVITLSGKVAILTGASRGIGEAIAHAYARSGARVVLAARKPEALERVGREIAQAGGEVLVVPCHMGKPDDVARLVKDAVSRFGQVDILVNNAATNPHFGPMLSIDEGAWDKTFEVNVKGYFAAARHVAQHLLERGAPGCILNVASVVALGAAPLQGVYGMTKAAVVSMTQTLAYELGPSGIRVNAIAPGLIKTKFAGALLDDPSTVSRVVSRTPLGRVGAPEEIAGAAVFLASDAASFITGQTLVIDGGKTLAAL